MDSLTSQYPVLFGADGKETEGQDEEGDDVGADSGSSFRDVWGWVSAVDRVSQTMRTEWDKVYKMPAMEFLNVVSYIKDKTEEEKREIEKWKKRN